MSITQAQRARLGLFFIIGCTLLVIFVSIPVGYKFTNKQKRYFSYFEGESLSGLDQGATVKFRGIPIGKVDRISYDSKNLGRVKVYYRIDKAFPVKEDMFAQTGMIGITGLLYVEIMGGTNTTKTLPPDSEIPSKPSLMASISGKTEVIVAKVELLLNHLNAITHPDSVAIINKILDNVESITATTKQFATDLSPDIKAIQSMAESGKIVAGRMEGISSDIRVITKKLKDSLNLGEITAIIRHVDSSALTIKNLSQTLNLTILQSREDFSITMQNLREAVENTNELTQMLLENPSLILKGETQKKRSTE